MEGPARISYRFGEWKQRCTCGYPSLDRNLSESNAEPEII